MSFKKVRDAHKTENTEDYCEIIGDLLNAKGEARIVDIANKLGIAQACAIPNLFAISTILASPFALRRSPIISQ